MSLRGFGFNMDLSTGRQRQWYAGEDGVRRWLDTNEPLDIPRPIDPLEDETE